MTVALVASRALTLRTAIPIIMGANIGTSVTAIIVSIAHIGRSDEFERAFAASTVHDFFNLIAVIILFPLQLTTNFLGAGASFMATQFQHIGGLEFANPIKIATAPVVDLLTTLASQFGGSATGWIMLIVAVVFLFVSLRYIVII